MTMIHKNIAADFSAKASTPMVDPTAYIHPLAAGRGDEGQPLFMGNESNVQDGVVVHGLETEHDGHPVEENLVVVDGKKYAVYIGEKVSLAHQAQIHGPAFVGNETFAGMKSLVFRARVGNNCVIEPGCLVMEVNVPDGRYVPAGTILKNQNDADNLPGITSEYAFKDLNRKVVHVNVSLADGYRQSGIK